MNDDIHTPEASATQQWSAFKTFVETPKGKLAVVVLVVCVILGLLTWQAYARPVTQPLVRVMARIIPLPALSVDGKTITINEFLTEYDALGRYFQDAQQEAPPSEQLEIAIVDTLINKIAIAQLADQYGVELDQKRVEQYYQEVLSAQESEKVFEESLSQIFGWTVKEFKTRIVESIVLAFQMTDVVLADRQIQQPRRELIDLAFARVQAGEDFAFVAKDVHAGFEGIQGDLGYVKASAIPDSWASQVTSLEEGQVTEIIDLPEGYAIFKLEEKIVAGEDSQLHLLSITVPKVMLEQVVDDYLTTVKVKRYIL